MQDKNIQKDRGPLWNAFTPLIGKMSWQVKLGYASCMHLEFGEPHVVVDRLSKLLQYRLGLTRQVRIRGDWHLWIFCCDWRIRMNGITIGHAEGSEERRAAAAKQLDGQHLIAVEANPEKGTSVFTFDEGGTLETLPFLDEPDCSFRDLEQWILYSPSGTCFTYRGDGKYSMGPSNLPPDEEVYLPLEGVLAVNNKLSHLSVVR